MEVAHHFFGVEVPQHLKSNELFPIVVAGEARCALGSVAAQLCGSEPYDAISRVGSPLRNGRFGNDRSGGGAFAARNWCPRVVPQLYLHPTCHLGTAASMFQCKQLPPSIHSAHLVVASHTLGVGSAGPYADATALAPLLLLPHATVVWNTCRWSWQQPASVLLTLCNLVAVARIANAHLTTPHAEDWERQRSLMIVLHEDNTAATHGNHRWVNTSDATQRGAADGCDEEEEYQLLIHDDDSAETDVISGGVEGGGIVTVPAGRLLDLIPSAQRQLLERSFGSITAVCAPRSVAMGAAQRFAASAAQLDDHRALVGRILQAACSNAHRVRSGTGHAAQEPSESSKQRPTKATGSSTAGATHQPKGATSLLPHGLPTATLLSRYFAECAVRLTPRDIQQLPFLNEGATSTTAGNNATLLRRLQWEFAVQDALSDLERIIVQKMSSDATWTRLIQQPTAGDDSVDPPHGVQTTATPTTSRPPPPAVTLDQLCHMEASRLSAEYFGGADGGDPKALADYRAGADALIDELKRDACRRSAEAKRLELQHKLLARLDAVAPLLEKLLLHGRFATR